MKKKLTVLIVLILLACLCVSTTTAGVLYYLRTRQDSTATLTPGTNNSVKSVTEPYVEGTTLIYKANNSEGNFNVAALIPDLGIYENFNKNVTAYTTDVNKLYVVINVPSQRDNFFVKIDTVTNNVDWLTYKSDLDCSYTNMFAAGFDINIDRSCFSRIGDTLDLDPNTGFEQNFGKPVSLPQEF
ncbi:MAG: hypothetical protein ACMG57_03025 [Candidatus Dojkabacteria bacterium]